MNTDRVHWKMKYRSMRSDDRSWPIRLADLNKCYDSCNYFGISMCFEQVINDYQVYCRNKHALWASNHWLPSLLRNKNALWVFNVYQVNFWISMFFEQPSLFLNKHVRWEITTWVIEHQLSNLALWWLRHSGKSATIWESKHGLGVCKEHYHYA